MLLVHRNANLATTTESIILQEYGNRFHNRIKPNKSNCNFLSENFALISHNSVFFPQNCKTYTKNCEITNNFLPIFSPPNFDFSELRVYISEFVFHNSDYFFSQNCEKQSPTSEIKSQLPFLIYSFFGIAIYKI